MLLVHLRWEELVKASIEQLGRSHDFPSRLEDSAQVSCSVSL